MAKYQEDEKDSRVFVASWIILSGQWPESPEHREMGIKLDLALIDYCQEIWLCGDKISTGMAIELAHAQRRGLRVVDKTYTLDRETK